ncbi:uncharacterized protein LOC129739251 [Uranotaenia lowii]|uniref:uncharacterized protein LOC129739251 n=1 Tax=Uranotaenia lowii TaxID=190385 RepID=UPI00247A3A17|nr:uncharacterized protein LOC129739251 [Uranotaenia lowii]
MICCIVKECRWRADSVLSLGRHLRIVHEPLQIYECNYDNCMRRYNFRCSFLRHVRTHLRQNENPDISIENRILHHCQSEENQVEHVEDISSAPLPNELHVDDLQSAEIARLSAKFEKLNTSFNLKWLDQDNVARKFVFEIQRDFKSAVINPIQEIVGIMSDAGSISPSAKHTLTTMMDSLSQSETEYKFKKKLKEMKLYEDPIIFTISSELRPGVSSYFADMVIDDVKGFLMPLHFDIKCYLESKQVLSTILSNLKPSTDGMLRSPIDGSLWRSKTCDQPDKLIIPINLFFDDFTTSDTISPHSSSTKICGIYYYIPCLPPYVLSKLNNILVAGYFMAQDRKRFNNEELLHKLIDVFISLEETGINVSHEGIDKQIYFMISFITGDNLALSEVLDLVESPAANFYCRFCKRNKQQRENDTIEHEEFLRTEKSYEEDLSSGDVSLTGIKRESAFNRIPSFAAISNAYFDVMHDLVEGVCLYGLSHCLKFFILSKKYFTLDDLNCRKNLFVFGNLHSANIPNDIKDVNLVKQKIKMTASEIITITRFLPLIIGKLVPQNDPVWNYFCNLIKIFDLLMQSDISLVMLDHLKQIIKIHHEQYITLFKDKLKPKHHNLVHYATAIKMSGSLKRQWAMRCEAKHKQAKQYCRVNSNKKSLCTSLITKISYKFANSLLNNNFITPYFDIDASHVQNTQMLSTHVDLLEASGWNNSSFKYVSEFQKQGSIYSNGSIFYVQKQMIINIYEIEAIILTNTEELLLICNRFESKQFDNHLQSYELEKRNESCVISDLKKHETKLINIHSLDSKMYLRMCNFIVIGT